MFSLAVLSFLLVLAAVVVLVGVGYRAAKSFDGEWHSHVSVFSAAIRGRRLVMRRKVEGKWEYREPTKREEVDYASREGW
jgi:hypothetical protein